MQPTIKIYRDGQFSAWETYKPYIHAKLLSFGNKVDRFFVEGKWPTSGENEQPEG